ncbi:hypothetical protein niasHS_015186 [Heterodera schachtii]|uniref:Copper transporter n=1 Tax=Heterodera schachtii TaxID=97005 RepID=A0ABD2I5C2_HETSC
MSPALSPANGFSPRLAAAAAEGSEEEDRISTSRVGKLPASERVALGLALVEGQQGLRDGYYVNVRNADAFLVTIIYSRASIIFIALIGAVSCFNTLLFNDKLSDASNLCQLHKLLPTDDRRNAMPVLYYCRFLRLSVFTNVFQLFLCLFALVWALNRRSNLFLLCYALLCLVLLLASLSMGTLFAVGFDLALRQSVQFSLRDAFAGTEPRAICRQMPTLQCLQRNGTEANDDASVSAFGVDRMYTTTMMNTSSYFCETTSTEWSKLSPLFACSAELSSALIERLFLFAFVLEYLLLLSIGFVLSAKLVANRRRRIRGLKAGKLGQLSEEGDRDGGTTPSVVEGSVTFDTGESSGDLEKDGGAAAAQLHQQKQHNVVAQTQI